jgi:hypothetical protein
MGAVAMESKFLGDSPIDNYPDYETTNYIYCDKCGSFQVEGYISSKAVVRIGIGILLLVLSVIIALLIMAIPFLGSVLPGLLSCPVWIFAGIIFFYILACSTQEDHECRKCGNTAINKYSNTLAYPPHDASVLDVPVSAAHKHRA